MENFEVDWSASVGSHTSHPTQYLINTPRKANGREGGDMRKWTQQQHLMCSILYLDMDWILCMERCIESGSLLLITLLCCSVTICRSCTLHRCFTFTNLKFQWKICFKLFLICLHRLESYHFESWNGNLCKLELFCKVVNIFENS